MCHGFPGLGYSYRHQSAALAEAGFRSIALDMPGYGGTTRPDAIEDYTNDAVANRLLDLLEGLGIDKAVFVGHDFGAPAAGTTARRPPDRGAGLDRKSTRMNSSP